MTALGWSKAPPIEPGVYMFRAEGSTVTVFHAIERLPSGDLSIVGKGALESLDVQSLSGEWKGPLSASELAKWR